MKPRRTSAAVQLPRDYTPRPIIRTWLGQSERRTILKESVSTRFEPSEPSRAPAQRDDELNGFDIRASCELLWKLVTRDGTDLVLPDGPAC
jgi:hypothetical protein